MATTDGHPTTGDGDDDDQRVAVAVHRCSSDRIVFVDQDNSEAWIATDTTVNLQE